MSFGEMSITLDDVSFLLHLPTRGVSWSPQDVTEEVVVELVVDYLGVSQSKVLEHVCSCKDFYYKLELLYDLFKDHRFVSRWDYATRVYMLMLMGSIVFVDKTFTLVEAQYLLLFMDLERFLGYSWGINVLVTLYNYLIDDSMFSCNSSVDILPNKKSLSA